MNDVASQQIHPDLIRKEFQVGIGKRDKSVASQTKRATRVTTHPGVGLIDYIEEESHDDGDGYQRLYSASAITS